MSSFKDGLRRSGQSVLDARAQNLYEMTKIEEERFIQECKMKVLRIKNELNKQRKYYDFKIVNPSACPLRRLKS